MVVWTRCLWLSLAGLLMMNAVTSKQPHIVFILADDLGWNYVSWHNSTVISPNMQELVDNGVELDQSYVQPLCTPSRSALMTGMYPYHLGRQESTIHPYTPAGVPLNYTFLPEQLRNLGYHTHAVGKWHLGFCDWAYTPLQRGFDTFYGFYNGALEYYYHWRVGYDFRDQENVDTVANGTHSTDLFTARAVDIILSHKHHQDEPMFLYLPFQAIHSPLEVPKEYIDLYSETAFNKLSQIGLGMVTHMDEGIGLIVDALKETGMYNDTIIIFSTDNGGTDNGMDDTNAPLRGSKALLWEGGTRGAAFMHGPLLENTPRTHTGLLHITDWYNTLLAAAGATQLPDNDGYDQWEVLRTGTGNPPREQMIYNIIGEGDDLKGAIRVGDYKYIYGDKYTAEVNHTEDTTTWLVNLKDDPAESTNLMDSNPDLAIELHSLLLAAAESQVPVDLPPFDYTGDPENYDGFWTPGWCEAK